MIRRHTPGFKYRLHDDLGLTRRAARGRVAHVDSMVRSVVECAGDELSLPRRVKVILASCGVLDSDVFAQTSDLYDEVTIGPDIYDDRDGSVVGIQSAYIAHELAHVSRNRQRFTVTAGNFIDRVIDEGVAEHVSMAVATRLGRVDFAEYRLRQLLLDQPSVARSVVASVIEVDNEVRSQGHGFWSRVIGKDDAIACRELSRRCEGLSDLPLYTAGAYIVGRSIERTGVDAFGMIRQNPVAIINASGEMSVS